MAFESGWTRITWRCLKNIEDNLAPKLLNQYLQGWNLGICIPHSFLGDSQKASLNLNDEPADHWKSQRKITLEVSSVILCLYDSWIKKSLQDNWKYLQYRRPVEETGKRIKRCFIERAGGGIGWWGDATWILIKDLLVIWDNCKGYLTDSILSLELRNQSQANSLPLPALS